MNINEMKLKDISDETILKYAEELKAKREEPEPPEDWEGLGMVEGWYIDAYSEPIEISGWTTEYYRNTFATEAQAEASIYLAQLTQLYKRFKEVRFPDWEADWADIMQYRWGVAPRGVDRFDFPCTSLYQHKFPCPTYELAHEFLARYRKYFEGARELL